MADEPQSKLVQPTDAVQGSGDGPGKKVREKGSRSQKKRTRRAPRADYAPASWVFGTLLLGFILYSFALAPDALPEFKQRLLAFTCALMAGVFGFFLTGNLGLVASPMQSRFGAFQVRATGGFAAFALVLLWWFSPFAPVKLATDSGGLYRVRVMILDTGGLPIDEASVWSSIGGEPKRVAGGWELNIPTTTRPADGRLTVYAARPEEFLLGKVELVLDRDVNPAVTIKLHKDRSASVRGRVIDAKSNPIAQVSVHVVGHENDRIATGSAGEFTLAAHAAKGEMIRLHAEKKGFASEELVHAAGDEPATVILYKK